MNNMSLIQIARACSGQLMSAGSFKEYEVSGVVTDSRSVEKDFLFIAVKGERVDGHDFIDMAFEKGALAAVCEKAPVSAHGPYILVEDSLIALKEIAKWYRKQLDIKVVGITGSVGKTSTKEFISSVLSQRYQVLKTEGNFNNEIGLPLTVLKIKDSQDVAVLEMGISDFGEMHRLSEIARPDICVITNIGQCHLENLGSRQGILKAKSEIFDFMNEDGSICVNGDDDMLVTIGEVHGIKPVRFGMNKHNDYGSNDVYATDIKTLGLFGSACEIHVQGKIIPAEIPLPGQHMILNALAAASVASILHLTPEEIAAGIKAVKPVGGRSNIIRHQRWTIIDDCYNANPVSMKAAIDLLTMADTRKVALLGDMFELGSRENALHEEVGIYAVSKNLDVIVCTGKLSFNMYKGVVKACDELQSGKEKPVHLPVIQYYETREALLEALPGLVKDEDTILVKASHGMKFENVVNALEMLTN